MTIPRPHSAAREGAFSLVEVTLALGIAAFCLVALLGILPLGSNQNLDASKATGATNLASAVFSDLRSVGSGTGPTPVYGVALPAVAGTSTATHFFASEAGEYLGATRPAGVLPLYQVLVRVTAPPFTAKPLESAVVYVRISEPSALLPETNAAASEFATTLAR